ncbi:MAG TPA: ABC transporter substrate-binding protein [Alphaproteobacteria bacterium]
MRKITALVVLMMAVLGAAAGARAEVNELRIGLQFGFIYLPATVAVEEKFIDKRAEAEGLGAVKVTISRFSGSTAINDAVLSGNVDLGAYGLPGMLIVWDKTRGRQDVRGVAAFGRNAFVVVTNKPAIKSLKDFGDDDRISLPATNSPQAILLKMASEKLYGPGNVSHFDTMMVALPHPDSANALLSGNTISGYVSTPPFQQFLLRDSRIHAVATAREILDGEEATGVILGGARKFVEDNPKVTRALYLALDDAMHFIRANRARAAEIYIASENSKLSKNDVQEMLGDGSTEFDVAPHGLKRFADFMKKIGMLGQSPEHWKETFFPVAYGRIGS